MPKSIALGQVLCKYYFKDNEMRVAEGILESRGNKKWVIFGCDEVPDERFPGYRNIERVWANGEVLWLAERDDDLAKRLFTRYYVEIIKDLQKQIDDAGDQIEMIRKARVRSADTRSKCFEEFGIYDNKQKKPNWVRTSSDNYDTSEFVDAEQYVERKIIMLKEEMCINLSAADEIHMKSLKTRDTIDACVRSMINKYWD